LHIHQWKMWCRKKLHLTWILPIASHNNAKSLASCWAFELHHHNSQGGIPPRVDCNVMKVNFFQRSCVFILLNPMEETNLFLVNYFHIGIYTPINDMNNIPICLGTICHEPLGIGICYTFLQDNYIQLLPKYTSSSMSSDCISQIVMDIIL